MESFADVPLPDIIKSYLYLEYSDDADLQAFVAAFNSMAQDYLDWFNQSPLGLYTSPHITGNLLDWIGNGIYGIPRPVVGIGTSKTIGELNSVWTNELGMNAERTVSSGTAALGTDDIYKRVMTWILYRGDGKQPTVSWLRRRVTRFLYGINGTDIPLTLLTYVKEFSGAGYNGAPFNALPFNAVLESFTTIPIYVDFTQNVSLDFGQKTTVRAGYGTAIFNALAYNFFSELVTYKPHHVNITIPTSPIAQAFSSLLQEGFLPFPFQMTVQVTL